MAKAFALPPDAEVTACARVLEGALILHVLRDGEDGWQFLCGEGHDGTSDPAKRVPLADVLKLAPEVVDLADLAPHEGAQRHSHKHAWVRYDGYEDVILENVEEHGWHAVVVPDDEEGPGFAYSIGQEPEIVLFGLEPEVMHKILAACADAAEIKPGVLEGFQVVFRPVAKERYKDYLGYAMWYHEGDDFPALQCVWADGDGKFPWDRGFPKDLLPLQPLLG
ncbi:MAG TPA: DUF4262 domain-containing protein [Planctomycetota bacterium]